MKNQMELNNRLSPPKEIDERIAKFMKHIKGMKPQRSTQDCLSPHGNDSNVDQRRSIEAGIRSRLMSAGYTEPIINGTKKLDSAVVKYAKEIHDSNALLTMLAGKPATGKTVIACRMAVWRFETNTVGVYVTRTRLEDGLNEDLREKDRHNYDRIKNARWLVVDDIHRGKAWSWDELSNIVLDRFEHGNHTLLIGPMGYDRKLDDQLKWRAEIKELTWPAFR